MSKAKLVILALILFSPNAFSQQSFEVDITVNQNGSAIFEDVELTDDGPEEFHGGSGKYIFKAKNIDGEVLWKQNRSISFFIFTNPPSQIDNKLQSLSIPYKKEIESIELYKDGELILSQEIDKRLCDLDGECSPYCNGKGLDVDCTCGDKVCQNVESQEVCPEDCGGLSQGSGNQSSEIPEKSDGGIDFKYVYILLAVLISGLIWMIFRSDL